MPNYQIVGMRKLILAGVLLLAASSARAATIVFTWTYNYAVDVPCAGTVTTNCVSGFELSHMVSGVKVVDANVPNPVSPVDGTTVTTALTFTGPYGPVAFNLVAKGVDSGGNRVDSFPATATVVNVPGKPGGFTAVVQ